MLKKSIFLLSHTIYMLLNAFLVLRHDNPDTVLARLHTYHQQTEPLKGYYANKGILIEIEGQEEVADTTKLTLKAIEEVLA